MITRESIAEKLGFDPSDHEYDIPDYECGYPTEDEKRISLLSVEERNFIIELALAEAAKKKAGPEN